MRSLWKAFQWLPPGIRWRWVTLLPLLTLAAAIEAVAAASIFALLGVLTEPTASAALSGLTSWAGAFATPDRLPSVLAALVVSTYLVRFAVLTGISFWRERVASASVVSLANLLVDRYLTGPFAVVVARGQTRMLVRAERAPEVTVTLGHAAFVQILAEVLVMLGLVSLLVIAAPMVTLAGLAVMALLFTIPAVLTRRMHARWAEQEQALEERRFSALRHGFGAMREIRVYGREVFFSGAAAAAHAALATVKRRRVIASDLLRLGSETAFVLVLAMLMGGLVLSSGQSVLPLLGLAAYAGFRFVPSANRITLNLNSMRTAGPYAEELCAELQVLSEPGDAEVRTRDAMEFRKELRCSEVSYQYVDATRAALRGVSFGVKPGETIAIAGPSGSGKSTLIDVLLGLIRPTSGTVFVDGTPMWPLRREWQRRVGYVAQAFYLLDGTIAQNVAFGIDRKAVEPDRLDRAIRLAQLQSVVDRLPHGVAEPLGDAGARLSGGERQRVAIARALYGDPDVLVFDEATSSLDPGTEHELLEALSALKGQRTLIVVAHREVVLRQTDRVVLLRDGQVEDVGRFDEIFSRSEYFRRYLAAAETAPGVSNPGASEGGAA